MQIPCKSHFPYSKERTYNFNFVADEGSNAAKSGFGYFEDDDDMEE